MGIVGCSVKGIYDPGVAGRSADAKILFTQNSMIRVLEQNLFFNKILRCPVRVGYEINRSLVMDGKIFGKTVL